MKLSLICEADLFLVLQLSAGEFDFVTCNGDCKGAYNVEEMKTQWFPNASNVTVHLQPDTAHVLNLARNASGLYESMLDHLNDHGL